MVEFSRERYTIYVLKVEHLPRNTIDALLIAVCLAQKGAGLVFHELGNVDINSDAGRVIYTTISAFAEMERKLTLQRCNEGRERAIEQGRHLRRFLISNRIQELAEQGIR